MYLFAWDTHGDRAESLQMTSPFTGIAGRFLFVLLLLLKIIEVNKRVGMSSTQLFSRIGCALKVSRLESTGILNACLRDGHGTTLVNVLFIM